MPRKPIPLKPSASPLAAMGAEIRVLRERRTMSLDSLGERAGYSGSYIGAVERAEEMPKREFIEDMDVALNAEGALLRFWDHVLVPSVYPNWFDWPQHEADASILRAFELGLVYGLLQTEDYARAVLFEDEKALAGRMARQEILRGDEPPLVVCVMDEGVLWREIGGRKVMCDQLNHLVAMASENIHIHIVKSGRHRGLAGAFVLATLSDRREVGYVETAARGITTGMLNDLKTLSNKFESIRSQALSADQSLELIARTAEERWT